MVYTDDVVFLQLKKCASTHFARIAFDLWGEENVTYLKKHQRIPNNFDIDDRLVIGSVRNPWDWYVSWFSYGCKDDGARIYRTPSGRNLILGHGWRIDPLSALKSLKAELLKDRKQWERLHEDATSSGLFREWLSEVFGADPYILSTAYGRSPLNRSVGFMTFSYLHLFLDNPALLLKKDVSELEPLLEKTTPDYIVRVEHFEEDLIKALELAGMGLTSEQQAKIYSYKRTNESSRVRRLSHYYDYEASSLVRKNEHAITEMYDYTSPVNH